MIFKNIRSKSELVIYGITGAVLLILLIFQYFSYQWSVSKVSQIERYEMIKSYEAVIATILKDGEKILLSQVDTLAFDERIKTALKNKKNKFIMQEFNDQFQNLKEKYLITNWNFYSDQKKVLARMHNSKKFGEISNRVGLKLAIQTAEAQVQFSYSDSKILILRVIKPIYSANKKLLGAIELGIDMSDLLSRRFGGVLPHKFDHVLLTGAASLDRAQWKNRDQMPNETELNQIVSDSHASQDELVNIFRNLGDILNSENNFFINQNKIFQVINVKYNDRVNKVVAKIILAYPASTILPTLEFSILVMSVITGLMFILLVYAFVRVFYANQKILQQSIKQAKMSTLGEMAANIAHEINNPLAIISGKTQIIKSQINSKTFDNLKLNSDLHKIVQTIGRIDRIVKGIKLLSRSSEQDSFEYALIDRIIQETLEICNERIYTHQVELRLKISAKNFFECRPTQIAQVLLNLIGNSLDAIEKMPNKWIELEATQSGATIIISITDSGMGIAEAIQGQLAQPFFTTKAAGKGTGLGLSIARGIIESHGGTLKYDSSSKNTRFILVLPTEQSKIAKAG